MRAAALIGGIPTVFALLFLGGLFGLNGATWTWWRWASYAAVTVAAIVTACLAWRRRRAELGRRSIAAILISMAAIAASLATMGQHFNDSYDGNLVWPHLLACVAFAGVIVVGVAVMRSAR